MTFTVSVIALPGVTVWADTWVTTAGWARTGACAVARGFTDAAWTIR